MLLMTVCLTYMAPMLSLAGSKQLMLMYTSVSLGISPALAPKPVLQRLMTHSTEVHAVVLPYLVT
jgi:hypothetical protein